MIKTGIVISCNLCLPGCKHLVSRWQCSQLSKEQRKVLLRRKGLGVVFFWVEGFFFGWLVRVFLSVCLFFPWASQEKPTYTNSFVQIRNHYYEKKLELPPSLSPAIQRHLQVLYFKELMKMFLPPKEGAVSFKYSVNPVRLSDKRNQCFCAWQHSNQVLSLESYAGFHYFSCVLSIFKTQTFHKILFIIMYLYLMDSFPSRFSIFQSCMRRKLFRLVFKCYTGIHSTDS